MGRILRCCLVMPLLIASAVTAVAQDAQEWKALGPPGASIRSIAVDPGAPDRVYAVDSWGLRLFRSADHGGDWQQVPFERVTDVAFGPTGDLYVVTFEHSYKSTDHGRTWQTLQGVDSLGLIAPAQSDARVLYAFGGGTNLLRSADAGATWVQRQFPPTDNFYLASLIVDPIASDTVYAVDQNQSLFKSTDGAASWTVADDGLPTGCGTGFRPCLLGLTIDPSAPATLYVGTNGFGIYRSSDGAQTWAPLGGDLGDRTVVALAVDPSSSKRLYAAVADDPTFPEETGPSGGAVYRSDDGGEFWTETSARVSPASPVALSIAAHAPENVYLATLGAGVLASADGGATWRSSDNGLNATCVASAVALDTAPTTLVASVAEGLVDADTVLIRDGRNGVWSDVGGLPTGESAPKGFSMVADPSDPSIVYASSRDAAGTVFRSVDGGHTWTPHDISPLQIGALVVDPASPTTLYAACVGCGVAKSTDGALTWSATTNGLSQDVFVVAVDPASGTVYAAGDGVAFASSDGGASWSNIAPIPGHDLLLKLVVVPTTPATLFAATQPTGITVSHDGGASWQDAHLRPPDLPPSSLVDASLALSPVNANTVYGMVADQLYRTDDAGQTWRPIGARLGFGGGTLVVDPRDPDVIYAATCGGGLFELRQASPAAAAGGGGGCAIGPPVGPPTPAAGLAVLALASVAARSWRARRRRAH